MRRLPMRKIHEVLRLSAEGLSTRQIEASLVIGRTALRGYLERARVAGLRWPLPPDLSDADIERLLFPRTCQRRSKTRPRGGVKVGHVWRAHETAGRA